MGWERSEWGDLGNGSPRICWKAYSFDGVDDWININFDWDDLFGVARFPFGRGITIYLKIWEELIMFFGMNGEKHSLFIYGEMDYILDCGQNSFFEIPPLRKWHNFVLSWDALRENSFILF